ncbi:unnamed protein product [Dicrocoelium dendriticum]|nr:unnamed protein product [Dicrocoelium dendriticum]
MAPKRGDLYEEEASRLYVHVTQFLPDCANKLDVYHRLSAQFPGRCVEGIKKQLMKMRWPRRRTCSECLLWDSPVVVRVPPIVLPEVDAELTESDFVSAGTTTKRDPDQIEAALELNFCNSPTRNRTVHSWRVLA